MFTRSPSVPTEPDRVDLAFRLDGHRAHVLGRLFRRGAESLRLGPVCESADPVHDPDELDVWTRFADYLMEGFVPFDLRVRDDGTAQVLEVRFLGTNRDAYLASSLRHVIQQAKIRLLG